MKKFKNENRFIFTWGVCIIVLFLMCSFSFVMKGTRAHFNGTTGVLEIPYKVFYSSNWPDSSLEDEIFEHKNKNKYILLSNMFEVPLGYQFVGWNTQDDGGGILYIGTAEVTLTEDLYLYAQWSEVITYGDTNDNGEIDEFDYLLVENYLVDSSVLSDRLLKNADVNSDGVVDLVDADIIKQAYLGTTGYVGFLPDKPILIYDIYEGNIDIGNGDGTEDNGDDNSTGSETVTDDGGTGNGATGTGSGSSGQGSNSSSTGGNGSGGASSKEDEIEDNKNNNEDIPLDDDNSVDNSETEIYEFVFMNGNIEYANSSCKIVDGKCLLVLPNENPIIDGYRFTGWSLNKGCPEGSGIIKSVYVDSDGIYYACFENNKSNGNNMYLWIIVLGICIISIRLIWYLIYKFRNEVKEEID